MASSQNLQSNKGILTRKAKEKKKKKSNNALYNGKLFHHWKSAVIPIHYCGT